MKSMKFNVGDRVAIYSDEFGRITGAITGAPDDNIKIDPDVIHCDGETLNKIKKRWFHIKQCRKLMKKKSEIENRIDRIEQRISVLEIELSTSPHDPCPFQSKFFSLLRT